MTIFISFVLLSLVISCENAESIIDKLISVDKTIAKVLDYSLVNNSTFTIRFNETVELIDLEFDGTKLNTKGVGQIFTFTLPKEINRGETKTLSLMVKKENGNTTLASFLLVGKNNDIPYLLINEVSIKGTATAPDRIELLVVEEGNLAGITLSDGFEELSGHTFILPELDVKRGDIIVIYWDSASTESDTERDYGKMTYYLRAKSPTTLLSTNGVIVLKSETDGYVMDCLIYSNKNTDEYSGFGNEKLEKAAKALLEQNAWEGSAVDSSLVTSSRVLARLPDGVDTDSLSDWFTTKARKSTFGEENIYEPYED